MTDFTVLLDHIARTETVTIVTERADSRHVATPIWAVVADGIPYVRSAYGDNSAWNRRARSGRSVAFSLEDGRNAERDAVAALAEPRVAVTVVHIAPDAAEQHAVDEAYQRKYGHTPYIDAVVSDAARALTLRVEPA